MITKTTTNNRHPDELHPDTISSTPTSCTPDTISTDTHQHRHPSAPTPGHHQQPRQAAAY